MKPVTEEEVREMLAWGKEFLAAAETFLTRVF